MTPQNDKKHFHSRIHQQMLGIGVYGPNGRWVEWLYDLIDLPRGVTWWFKCRFDHNHTSHIVRTGLQPGGCDVDTIMLHACFSLLKRYVEQENGGELSMQEHINYLQSERAELEYEFTPDNKPIATWATPDIEALRLYRWWEQYAAQYRASYNAETYEERHMLHDQLNQQEEDNLISLMRIRGSLWT